MAKIHNSGLQIDYSKKCLEDLLFVLEKKSECIPARILVGRAYVQRFEYVQAEEQLDIAISCKRSSLLHFERGEVLLMYKKNPKVLLAIDDFTMGIDILLEEFGVNATTTIAASTTAISTVTTVATSAARRENGLTSSSEAKLSLPSITKNLSGENERRKGGKDGEREKEGGEEGERERGRKAGRDGEGVSEPSVNTSSVKGHFLPLVSSPVRKESQSSVKGHFLPLVSSPVRKESQEFNTDLAQKPQNNGTKYHHNGTKHHHNGTKCKNDDSVTDALVLSDNRSYSELMAYALSRYIWVSTTLVLGQYCTSTKIVLN